MDKTQRRAYDNAYHKNRSPEAKAKKVLLQKQRRHALGRKIVEYLLEHPCAHCGEADPVVLQFDHLGDKTMNISDMVGKAFSWANILREIEKCRILCANCHMRHTAKQFGWVNYK